MAEYLGQNEDLGSIAKGKYADFFLVEGDPTDQLDVIRQIRMVASNGVIYFPEEIYPHFGIKPFATSPPVTQID
jgi:imidazolonepropionase-like amidohydrolase